MAASLLLYFPSPWMRRNDSATPPPLTPTRTLSLAKHDVKPVRPVYNEAEEENRRPFEIFARFEPLQKS